MIGIHLGANYTRVAIMKDSYPTMVREIDIPRDGNADRLASVVSFRNNQIRFGAEAFKTQEREIIFDACRAAPNYKSDIWHAKRSDDGKYTVRGLSENNGTISQEEVISKILTRIREIVETRYGDNFIQSVVLSHPPECIQTYQDMLKKAAKNAFNRDAELLEERVAAAKTFYKLSPLSQDPHHLLVFKFGAGSLGISVFEKKNDENDFKQLESTSDPNMGGEDITNLLIWYCQKEFKEKLEENEIRNKLLRESCERVKSDLSYFAETKIFLDGDPVSDFTRDNFESLLKDNDIIKNIENYLKTIAEKIQSQGITINDVLLVGGSTRLHFIRKLIDTALKTDENIEYRYDTVVNPEEAIAMGCAIFSDNLKNITNSPIPEIHNNIPEEKTPKNSLSSLNEDENATKSSSNPSTVLNIEPTETTPLNPNNLQQQNQQLNKSSMNPLRFSQSNISNSQNFNQPTNQNNISGSNFVEISKHAELELCPTSTPPNEIDMPRSSTKKDKSQIKQNLKYKDIEKTIHISTASSTSSESLNYKTRPTDKTKGLNNDRGHLIVKGNLSSHTKEALYDQTNYWINLINTFKHISVIEKEDFANYYGKTMINKLPGCTGDEVVGMNFLNTAELCYQILKYKNDILEQFDIIEEKLGYIKENKIFLDKLNEKRKEVEKAIHFTVIDTAYDACINDLHQLLGTRQAKLKSPIRFASAKVSKWQEDELIKVLIKPQLYQCVYTTGSMSHLLKKKY